MSDHIPPELLLNIFRRLAAKDLVSCRRTSKQWLSIINDPDFIHCQLQTSLSAASSNIVFLQGGVSPLLYWRLDEIQSPISRIRFPYQPACQVSLIGSCHGLICFSKLAQPRKFVVINPSTGERHTFGSCRTGELEDRPPHQVAYGFGYDESTSDYKVVRIMEHDLSKSVTFSLEVYTVRGKSFSRNHPLPVHVWVAIERQMGVFAFGALHWPVVDTNTEGPAILAFDLGCETFRLLQVPFDGEWELISVGVVDSCMCVCALHEGEKFLDIWVMFEYDKFESWIKVYGIENHILIGDKIYFPDCSAVVGSNGCRILLLSAGSRFFSFYRVEKRVEPMEMNLENDNGGSVEAVSYVESLVRIFPK